MPIGIRMAPTKRKKKYVTAGRTPFVWTSVNCQRKKRVYINRRQQQQQQSTSSTIVSQQLEPVPVVEDIENTISSTDQTTTSSRYYTRKQKEVSQWIDIRSDLLSALVEKEAANNFCSMCNEFDDVAIFRCLDCGPNISFCQSCLLTSHIKDRKIFHIPEVWIDGTFVKYKNRDLNTVSNGHKSCSSSKFNEVHVFDYKGRYHCLFIEMCSCEAEISTLLRLNLWPATPKEVRVAYSVELLKWMECLLLECKVPLSGFCSALACKNNLQATEIQFLQRILASESFFEFRSARNKIKSLEVVSNDFGNGTECAACPNISKIVCIDANFGLVRRHKAGKSFEAPKNGNAYFLNDGDVQNFVTSYDDQTSKIKECNSFQAGNKLRSKVKNKKLDVTGVFGSVCRHESPMMFLDMHHGERLAYPMFMLRKLLEECNGQELNISYDIACKLVSHLQKTNQLEILNMLNLVIPTFHCYGHKASCQIQYNPRRKKGFALTDGEGIERLWSFLRGFSKITKEMTPSHRIDTLSDALLHFNRRKHNTIDKMLVKRYKKAHLIILEARNEIEKYARCIGRDIDEGTVRQWQQSQSEMAENTEDIGVLGKLESLSKERTFLLHLKKKYCNGQAIANRICRQIQKVNTKIKKLLGTQALIDTGVTFQNITSGTLFSATGKGTTIPTEETFWKQKLIDSTCLKSRAEEELVMLELEMKRVIKFLVDRRDKCLFHLQSITGQTMYEQGIKSLLLNERQNLKQRIMSSSKLFSYHVPGIDLNLPDYFKTPIHVDQELVENVQNDDNDTEEDNDDEDDYDEDDDDHDDDHDDED